MKNDILEIITQHKFEHISDEQTTEELLALFTVSNRSMLKTILEEIDGNSEDTIKAIITDFMNDC